jgi:hypothetical protein
VRRASPGRGGIYLQIFFDEGEYLETLRLLVGPAF